jgi:membrane fusion protein, heavy metal efflux system
MEKISFTITKSRFALLFAGVLLTFLFSCKQSESPKAESETFCLSETMKNQIELHEVAYEPIEQWIRLNGKVEANPEKQINFVSLVEGIVVNTHFSLGDAVKKGQLLAEIRSTELSGMQAESRTLQSQLAVAKRQLSSVRSMHEDGIASERDLLQARSEVEVLEAEIDKITSNLNLFSSSGTAGLFQIKAPSSGIIIENNIASGLQITEGDALFTISDLSDVWVSINVYAGNVSDIQTGMTVDIKTMSYPDENFEGTITRMSQVFDTEERVLKALVVLENKDFKLKPGMLVDVLVKKSTEDEAFAIPANSVIFDGNKNYVLVYNDECDISQRLVDIQVETNGTAYLRSGIAAGEKVISKSQLIIFEALKNQ